MSRFCHVAPGLACQNSHKHTNAQYWRRTKSRSAVETVVRRVPIAPGMTRSPQHSPLALPLRLAAVGVVCVVVTLTQTAEARPCRVVARRTAHEACHRVALRPQDQVWRISTRHLGPCAQDGSLAIPQLCYWRLDPCRGWISSSEAEFFASDDPSVITTVFLHGNRVAANEVDERGLKVYMRLLEGTCDAPPLRHVIWSWPSEPTPCRARVIRDVRVKACRTLLQSYYLAGWLARMHPDTPVSLTGFSYGGRLAFGALQLLGGGSHGGRCLPTATYDRVVTPRVVVWASASQANWLGLGGAYQCALRHAESISVIYNPRDPALRRYQRYVPDATGPALGAVGLLPCRCLGEFAGKVSQVNVACPIGPRHDCDRYLDCPAVMATIRAATLWQD